MFISLSLLDAYRENMAQLTWKSFRYQGDEKFANGFLLHQRERERELQAQHRELL
jgi:hypothetical protein